MPAISESGLPGFSNYIWFGLLGPKGMDPKVVERINTAVRQALETPEVRQKLVATGNTVRIESPAQFKATVKQDRAGWAELVRTIGVTIE